uniref:Uncharacterized protein n=1 Tax=Bubo bubo TaxID=30461 RepID=A0A8C0EI53_BUBBB
PQSKEAESSKVEAKAKALTAKKGLENIHSFKSTPQQSKMNSIIMRFPLTAESAMEKREDNTLIFITDVKTKAQLACQPQQPWVYLSWAAGLCQNLVTLIEPDPDLGLLICISGLTSDLSHHYRLAQ